MELGKPVRTWTVEPVERPAQPEPKPEPAPEPKREKVPA